MKWTSQDFCRWMILVAIASFFGIGTGKVLLQIHGEVILWTLDFLGAFLFLSLFFWIFILKSTLHREH